VPRGRKQHVRVMSEADEIVRRLRETGVTVTGLMKEYRCGHRVLVRSVLSRMTRAQYRALAARRKGLRIPGCEKSWFKAGEIRGASARKYRAVGTIVVRAGKLRSHYKCSRRRESSRWIKVRDAGPLQGRYIPYARYLWEQAHGPVPEGWFVVHANNRSMDDRMENLAAPTGVGSGPGRRSRPGGSRRCGGRWRSAGARAAPLVSGRRVKRGGVGSSGSAWCAGRMPRP